MAVQVDHVALAALRPGESREGLAAAMGVRWRPPGPHEEGRVKAIARVEGFEARLDVTDHVARVVFREPFPADVAILGLKLGMSPEQAVAALPRLMLSSRLPVYNSAYYVAQVSDHYRMSAEFRWGKIYEIQFLDFPAVYPPKRPMAYPAPHGQPGDPFFDPNFKLVVLSALIESDALYLAAPKDLAEFVLQRPVDLEREGYALLRPAYDYLLRYPLGAKNLAAVETLMFDGGNDIYRFCFYFWSGETGEFDVRSVAGIGACANLRVFNSISILQSLDVGDLMGLAKLEQVSLPSDCRHPEKLLDLPALRRLEFHRPTIRDSALIAALKARGVAVRIFD